jgi:hypothetical protein
LEQKQVFVIPAFDADPNADVLPRNKHELIRLLMMSDLSPVNILFIATTTIERLETLLLFVFDRKL